MKAWTDSPRFFAAAISAQETTVFPALLLIAYYAAFSTLPDAPEPLNWLTALDVLKRHDRIDLLRDWTEHFRRQYRLALRLAQEGR